METILIVAKTRMANGVCVGGINESTCELIRLHDEKGRNLSADAPYEVGDRWSIWGMEKAWNCREKPHVEDKQVPFFNRNKIGNVGIQGIIDFINTHDFGKQLIKGSLDETFEGCLNLTGQSGFINRDKIPSFSTQFWIVDRDLQHTSTDTNKHYYIYNNIKIPFVGFQSLIDKIPAGTIVRISLANWWQKEEGAEERCYLQLSGWYISMLPA